MNDEHMEAFIMDLVARDIMNDSFNEITAQCPRHGISKFVKRVAQSIRAHANDDDVFDLAMFRAREYYARYVDEVFEYMAEECRGDK